MSGNITSKLVQHINSDSTDEDILFQLESVLGNVSRIYSYLVYARYKEDRLSHWQIEYTISQEDEYNTLSNEDVIQEVFKILKESKERKVANVIGYKQPSLDVQLVLFEPLINKLAMKQVQHWPQLEYDDACQICKMTMLNLYRKGYYLHKSLVERCYNNDILMYIRKDKNKPEVVSISKVLQGDKDDNQITIGDVIPDTKLQEESELKDYDEFIQLVYGQVKDIIVELIGQRQFDQLMRDYGNKHTTSWSRKKMQQLKDKFKQMGISWSSFDKYR